ncbi:hypothetical protein BJ165DRAFT_1399768 [Panaeolus papilionaceus]|nr:hypothetical protein BJ165DRAFT_1399768 [Panaeolus papilionaceus]
MTSRLKPLKDLTFVGVAKISIDVKKPTSSIVLLADPDLVLTKAYGFVLLRENAKYPIELVAERDSSQQRVTYDLRSKLSARTKAVLAITFSGKLAGNRTGLGYYASAWTKDGVTRHCSLTRFEPTSARRAFPCWDEPLLKATFDITMISRADTVNLSNMPAVKEEALQLGVHSAAADGLWPFLGAIKEDEWKVTKFGTTLECRRAVCLAYGKDRFATVREDIRSGISATEIVHVGGGYILITLATLDIHRFRQVHEFDPATMENWGLIIGSPPNLLLDPVRGDLSSKVHITSIQSHEIARQWFGNITTMAWWNCAYLNEGFATLTKSSDILFFFVALSSNPAACQMLTKYFQDNYDMLYERFNGTFTIPRLVDMSYRFYPSNKDYA